MRPLVRTEQIRLRMSKDTKNMIKAKAAELNLTVTAYLEMLANKDNEESIIIKSELIREED